MISDQELLHGAALLKLIENFKTVQIQHGDQVHSSLYVINSGESEVAVLLKLSTRRKSPWQFTFSQQEENAVARFRRSRPDTALFFSLVCFKDGVCCVNYETLAQLTGHSIALRSVGVSRPSGGSYHLSGPERQQLRRAIPQSDWPRALFQRHTPL